MLVRFCGGQSSGWGIQASLGKKTGLDKRMHPICSTDAAPVKSMPRRILEMLASMASRLSEPFLVPNASQANQFGSAEYLAKSPKPQIALWGDLSLNKKGEKGSPRKA